MMDAIRFEVPPRPAPSEEANVIRLGPFRLRRRRPREDTYWPEISIVINGVSLVDLIRPVELRFAEAEGHASIAGGYAGLAFEQLDGSPSNHFMGSPLSHNYCGPEDKTVLLACEGCRMDACWPLMARITTTDGSVTWSGFHQPHRADWSYEGVRFTFDRKQYEEALAQVGGESE